ncbi:MAG TPA: immunoglobulin domain-containing protein, partial [Candidatus Paceibacterota bacterium]|nr:immunoglobulin domain-containing protein [Candidatus Paceibacterota bacterium]
WRVGSAFGGTPGRAELTAPVFPQVVINEVLTYADPPLTRTIELLNCGTTMADIGGWFLSDDRRTPKYAIPPGTLLQPGACFLRTEADFNPTPGVPPSFNLRASGDEVYLFSANSGGHLTGYAHGFRYGAALKGVSFGRHLTSTGEEHFVAQAARTLGEPNGPPRVSPVVISEIHYHPPDAFANNAYWDNTGDEFIELCNVSAITVNLFDPMAPAHTWQLRDAVEFTFPPNQTMNPGTRLLVVSFDPITDPNSAAVFRSRYGLSGNVRLFGPYQGKLANGVDSVELVQPSSSSLDATNVASNNVLVDKVDYRDDSPWPAGSDGLGFSLQRRIESAYGNDPANWIAARPSPGAALDAGTEPVILAEPTNQTAQPGATVSFSVEANGPPPLQYQWRFKGENLPGAVARQLILTNVQLAQSGEYEIVVSTPSRSTVSAAAVLQVGTPPAIVQSPLSRSVWPGETVTFSVIALSRSPLQYTWRRNGTPLNGAVRSSLLLPNVDAGAEGAYDVMVSNETGFTNTSPVADLLLLGKPVFVQKPVGLTLAPGATATFQVTITNTAALPITYEWRKDNQLVTSHTSSTHTDSLTLTNVQPTDAGNYVVRVSNRALAAPGLSSPSAPLVVEADLDSDGDGLPDAFESNHGLNPKDPADAAKDADHDGASNLEEYLAGTNPQDATSLLKVDQIDGSGTVTIRFWCLTGRSYSLLYRDTIESQLWTSLTNIAAIAGTTEHTRLVEIVDPQAAGIIQRYYRLRTPALPKP